jgi:hypothetical protein
MRHDASLITWLSCHSHMLYCTPEAWILCVNCLILKIQCSVEAVVWSSDYLHSHQQCHGAPLPLFCIIYSHSRGRRPSGTRQQISDERSIRSCLYHGIMSTTRCERMRAVIYAVRPHSIAMRRCTSQCSDTLELESQMLTHVSTTRAQLNRLIQFMGDVWYCHMDGPRITPAGYRSRGRGPRNQSSVPTKNSMSVLLDC